MVKKFTTEFRVGQGGLKEVSSDVTLEAGVDQLVLVDATTGPVIVTLQRADGWGGKRVCIKKIDTSTNVVTIAGQMGQSICAAPTAELIIENQSLDIVSDNENWLEIAESTGSLVSLIKSFLFAGEGGGGTVAVVNNPIEFDVIDQSRGTNISLNVGSNRFTLQPRKTYKLVGGIFLNNVASGAINYRWRDLTNALLIGNTGTARSHNESIPNFSNQPVAMAIITVPDGGIVEMILEIVSFTGLTPASFAGFSYAMIEEI